MKSTSKLHLVTVFEKIYLLSITEFIWWRYLIQPADTVSKCMYVRVYYIFYVLFV